MEAGELRRKDRDELIALAGAHGVNRPEVLTKAELIDEILQRGAPGERRGPERPLGVRGWLGRARDLVASVIERGLHLPNAAQLVRGLPTPPMPKQPAPLPTVTLAEIYAAQGHVAKAVDVLDQVLERTPDHHEARALRERLGEKIADRRSRESVRGRRAPLSERATRPDVAEAASEATTSPSSQPPLSSLRGDEVVALATDPRTAYVYWEVRPTRFAALRSQDPEGHLVLRVLAVRPGNGGAPESRSWDLPIDGLSGDSFVRGLIPGAELRVCVAWSGPGGFVPVAVGAELSMPREPAAHDAEWRALAQGETIAAPAGALAASVGAMPRGMRAAAAHAAMKAAAGATAHRVAGTMLDEAAPMLAPTPYPGPARAARFPGASELGRLAGLGGASERLRRATAHAP